MVNEVPNTGELPPPLETRVEVDPAEAKSFETETAKLRLQSRLPWSKEGAKQEVRTAAKIYQKCERIVESTMEQDRAAVRANVEKAKEAMRAVGSKMPEELREAIQETLTGVGFDFPKNFEDEAPDGAIFLRHAVINLTEIERKRQMLQGYIRNGTFASVTRPTLDALNAYEQLQRKASAIRSPFAIQPHLATKSVTEDRENHAVRVLATAGLGALGILTLGINLFAKNKNFGLPAFYLALATLAAVGEKRLRARPEEKLLDEVLFMGPEKDFQRIARNREYWIAGEDWAKLSLRLKETEFDFDQETKDGKEQQNIVNDMRSEAAPKDSAERSERLKKRVFLTKLCKEEGIRGKFENLVANGKDFWTFVDILQKNRSEEADKIMMAFIKERLVQKDLHMEAKTLREST